LRLTQSRPKTSLWRGPIAECRLDPGTRCRTRLPERKLSNTVPDVPAGALGVTLRHSAAIGLAAMREGSCARFADPGRFPGPYPGYPERAWRRWSGITAVCGRCQDDQQYRDGYDYGSKPEKHGPQARSYNPTSRTAPEQVGATESKGGSAGAAQHADPEGCTEG